MRYLWILALIILGTICFVQNSEATRPRQVAIETRIIETDQNYSRNIGTGYGHLDRWIVQEDETVKQALEVYKRKAQPRYEKRIWIIDKRDEARRYPLDLRGKLSFSPNEDFVFWVGNSWLNNPMVYGIDLFGGRKFSIADSDNFDLLRCNNQKTYVVIEKEKGDSTYYYVYDLDGQKKGTFQKGIEICPKLKF